MSRDFDFGFSLVDENELEAVQQASYNTEVVSKAANETQDKLDALYNAIAPLLNNLKANPEKEYILWPNRVEKVEEFENHLRKLYES